MRGVDFHTHSTFSDGVLTPTQLVRRAAKFGVRTLALADHDSVAGLPEAARAARKYGIRLIAAIETTARYKNYNLHILGLGIDPTAPSMQRLLAAQTRARIIRARRMMKRLQKAGFHISWNNVLAASRDTIARPNIANAVLRRRENAARLRNEFGAIPSFHDFIKAYIVPGTPGYVEGARPTALQAVVAIHGANGLAIVAHPFGMADDLKMIGSYPNRLTTLRQLLRVGFDGIEAFHPATTPTDLRTFRALARRHKLILTGGSDFHDPKNATLGHYAPTKRIPSVVLAAMALDILNGVR